MAAAKFSQQRETVQAFFEMHSEALGRETGFVRRVSKMTALLFVQMLVMGLLDKGNATLNDLVAVGDQLGVAISAAGLVQRMNERGVLLLQRLLAQGLKAFSRQQGMASDLLASFSAVNIIDSTQISLPETMSGRCRGSGGSGSRAGVKVHVCYEYQQGTLTTLEVGDACQPDQSSPLPQQCARAGSLTLVDLGYFKQSLLTALVQIRAFFLMRLHPQASVYWQAQDKQPIDVLTALKAQSLSCGELSVYVGAQARVGVRLLFESLPSEVVARRRRQAKRKAQKKGRTCSAKHLETLAWNVYITNVPATLWTVQQAILTYRLRWHIEILFKLWKSQANLAQVRCQRPESFLCLLYARLLGLLIFHWLVAPARFGSTTQLSLTKAFHLFQRAVPGLIDAIADGWHDLAFRLARFANQLARLARTTSRRKHPSTYQRLLAAGL